MFRPCVHCGSLTLAGVGVLTLSGAAVMAMLPVSLMKISVWVVAS